MEKGMNVALPFRFGGMALRESCWLDGTPYFTRRAIGEWLEYSNPDVAIAKIVKKNPQIKEFSRLTNLVRVVGVTETDGMDRASTPLSDHSAGKKKVAPHSRELSVEVYDPIGLQLIINKSSQPRAMEFQVAAARLVLAYLQGDLVKVSLKMELADLLRFKSGWQRGAAVRAWQQSVVWRGARFIVLCGHCRCVWVCR